MLFRSSKDQNGKYHITLANLSCSENYEVCADLLGNGIKSANAQILAGKMDDKNTFEDPNCVKISAFEALNIKEDRITFTIPKNSVMHIEVEL